MATAVETAKGIMDPRRLVLLGITVVVVGFPLVVQPPTAGLYAQAMVFAIIGLSLNMLMGYAGQISLGHNAFVGIGAFATAFLTTDSGLPIYLSVPMAAAIGGVSASILGLVALRIKGLYLALITLSFGLVAERSILSIRAFTGGGAGKELFRPDPLKSDKVFAYVCLIVLALVLFIDWRMLKTKFGRALLALKGDELVASSLGMNPVFYKVGAFVLSGAFAGLGGGLLALRQELVVAQDFTFIGAALIYLIMVVVGGLGSRLGVVIGSAFISYLPFALDNLAESLRGFGGFLGGLSSNILQLKIAIPAALLLLTITLFPGGIAQQLQPLTDWLAGKPFVGHRARHRRQEGAGGGANVPETVEGEE